MTETKVNNKTTKVDIENIAEVIETARDILEKGTNISFDFDEGLDFFDASHHVQPTWDTFSTGFPYLDKALGGGWSSKALYIIAGENKVGKCSSGSTKIKIRNKKSGLIQEVTLKTFANLCSSSKI
jgi:predicted ATP-dependent serine protease